MTPYSASRLGSRSRWQNREAGNRALPGVNSEFPVKNGSSASEGCDGVHKAQSCPEEPGDSVKTLREDPLWYWGKKARWQFM